MHLRSALHAHVGVIVTHLDWLHLLESADLDTSAHGDPFRPHRQQLAELVAHVPLDLPVDSDQALQRQQEKMIQDSLAHQAHFVLKHLRLLSCALRERISQIMHHLTACCARQASSARRAAGMCHTVPCTATALLAQKLLSCAQMGRKETALTWRQQRIAIFAFLVTTVEMDE